VISLIVPHRHKGGIKQSDVPCYWLLMLVAPVKPNARTPKQSRNTSSQYVRDKDDHDQSSNNKESVFRFWWGEHGSAVCNFESAPNHHPDQERDDDKAQANKRALPPIQTMDNFRPATGADARALRNLLMAMWAHQALHRRTITPPVSQYEQISRTTLRH
jgi:hypothetical protein